jgi:spermidine synthase
MSPDRMLDLQLQIEPQPATPINRDFTPIAYYFDVVLWSSRFHSHWRELLEWLAGREFFWVADVVFRGLFALTLLVWLYERLRNLRHRKTPSYHATLGLCVAAMGFTLLGLEVLLLLGFQALYGYVYQQLSVLVAVFMVGMAAGAWLALKGVAPLLGGGGVGGGGYEGQRIDQPPPSPLLSQGGGYLRLALLQLLAGLSPLLLYAFFVLLERVRSLAALLTISQMVFPVLALIAGLMGGYQFPLASRIYFAHADNSNRGPGTLYALDLAGACLGAVALSAYLLPVFGFLRTAMLMAVLDLAPAALAGLAAFEARVRQT